MSAFKITVITLNAFSEDKFKYLGGIYMTRTRCMAIIFGVISIATLVISLLVIGIDLQTIMLSENIFVSALFLSMVGDKK